MFCFFFSLWLHCRNSSIISSVLQNHNGATFQSREETISSPPPLPRVDEFTLESKKKLSIFHHPFPFCMWFFFRCCGKYGQEVGIKSDLYQRVFATVSTPAARQERQRVDSFCEGGNGATIGSAFRHFGGHTSRSGKKKKRRSDEHIILRTSLLTMPIYFDNQLTIVPVQPLKGQWFIRIDQFWVTSCAALWGQTEAWLAVQSGMLSNAQAWLTAHQHAELNSLAKCFPFTLTSDTHIKLWISRSASPQ